MSGYTDLVNATRHDARNQLRRDVERHGADGVVVQAMELRVGEHECTMQEGRRDHVVEATIIGTAIAQFGRRKARGRAAARDYVAGPAAAAGRAGIRLTGARD